MPIVGGGGLIEREKHFNYNNCDLCFAGHMARLEDYSGPFGQAKELLRDIETYLLQESSIVPIAGGGGLIEHEKPFCFAGLCFADHMARLKDYSWSFGQAKKLLRPHLFEISLTNTPIRVLPHRQWVNNPVNILILI